MCSIYLENINFLYIRNIVTSIFLKLDYIYFIKLIKQIKYIIPLQKQIKLITKLKFFFFKFDKNVIVVLLMIHVF